MKTISNYILFSLLLLFGCKEGEPTRVLYGFDKDTLKFNRIKRTDTFQEKVFCKNYSKSKIKILQVEAG